VSRGLLSIFRVGRLFWPQLRNGSILVGKEQPKMTKFYNIIETSNRGSDYPNERFVNIPSFRLKKDAQAVADLINKEAGDHADRY